MNEDNVDKPIGEMTAAEAWAAIEANERNLPDNIDAASIEMYVAGMPDETAAHTVEGIATRSEAVRRHIELWRRWNVIADAAA